MNLEGLMQRYLKQVEAKFAYKTVKSYTERLRRFSGYLREQGVSDPSELSADVILRYPVALGSMRVNSHYAYVEAVKKFCVWLTDNHFVFVNPGHALRLPKWERRPKAIFSEKQVRRILAKVKEQEPEGSRNKAILVLRLIEGLKTSEIEALSLLDVDPFGELRLKRRRRFVKLKSQTVGYLKNYLKQRLLFRPKSDYLFLRRGGSKAEAPTIRVVLRTAFVKSK